MIVLHIQRIMLKFHPSWRRNIYRHYSLVPNLALFLAFPAGVCSKIIRWYIAIVYLTILMGNRLVIGGVIGQGIVWIRGLGHVSKLLYSDR
jgi:hypothetical protein